MPIDSSIALGVRPFQAPDPMESFGRVLALKHAMVAQQQQQQMFPLQQQEAAARLQSTQQENQVRQQGITDDKSARDFFSKNPNATDEDILAGVGPKVGNPIIAERIKAQESKLKMAGDKLDLFGRIASSIKDENTFHAGVQTALQNGLLQPQEAAQLHQQGFTPETQALIQQHSDQGMKAKEQVDAALAQLKERREKTEADAKLPGVIAESTSKQQKATGQEPIQPYQSAELAGQAATREQTASHNAATEANEKRLRDIATGNLAISQAHLKIAQQVHDQTYGPNANVALQGVEPKLRVQATGAAQKAADEYTKAMESTTNMQSILDLAKANNKVAYAYAPTTGVLTINTANGVKRVNMAEIKAYGGAGSALDRLEGFLGKQATGASIPKDILENMGAVNKSIADNAGSNYNTKLDGINQNYHSNFRPVGAAHGQATGGAVPEITSQADYDKLPKGAKYTNNGVPHVKQ